MNIQIGNTKTNFNFSSNEIAHAGELIPELDFVDYLLSPPFPQPPEHLAIPTISEFWFTSPELVHETNFNTAGFFEASQHNVLATQTADSVTVSLETIDQVPTTEVSVADEHHYTDVSISQNKPQIKVDQLPERQLAQSVSLQTINAIEHTLSNANNNTIQSITVEIQPRDLGQLNIQIELVADSLQAKIVATEYISADLLNRNKEELVSALSEIGYSQTDVDISHRDSQNQHESQTERQDLEDLFFDQTIPANLNIQKNPVVLVGINMLA